MSNYTEHRNDPPEHVGKELGGNGGDIGWSVEARLAYHTPELIAGRLLDDRWRTLYFDDNSPIGVPRGNAYAAKWLNACGLYEYAAAQALRWWFVAIAEASTCAMCLETRLVRHKIEYSYKHTAESAHAYIGGDDRSSLMPDWGKKATEPGIKAA